MGAAMRAAGCGRHSRSKFRQRKAGQGGTGRWGLIELLGSNLSDPSVDSFLSLLLVSGRQPSMHSKTATNSGS